MGKLGDFYGCDWRDGVEVMDIHENEKGTWDELEKGLLTRGEGRDHQDGAVNGRRKGYEGCSRYYKIMYASALLVLCWHYGLSTATPMIASRSVDGIPQFVLDYAPMVYLDTGEAYFPSDIAAQISNTHPEINYTPVANAPTLTVENLQKLNDFGGNGGSDVFLTSNLDITTKPNWLLGVVPDSNGKTNAAISTSIIVTDHGSGNLDAFYMYFYAYNQGNKVLGQELGDHIGDWEHNMVRFKDGIPQAIWYSQHGNGQAFTYKAVEKIGLRPVSYSAKGSHANYAIAGKHDHTIPDVNLPDGFLVDYTSKGMLWDPTLNSYFYNYSTTASTFQGINGSPTGLLDYKGKWGDAQYKKEDKRQKQFFGFWKYVGGPTGPGDKQLNREKVCPDNGILCILRDVLGP